MKQLRRWPLARAILLTTVVVLTLTIIVTNLLPVQFSISPYAEAWVLGGHIGFSASQHAQSDPITRPTLFVTNGWPPHAALAIIHQGYGIFVNLPPWLTFSAVFVPACLVWYRTRALELIGRCKRCKYLFQGLSLGVRCPECGDTKATKS